MKSAFTLVPTHRTKQSGYWLAGFIVLFMSVFSVSGLQAQTITTDKPDYAPGEYVIISGTGWLPGETVSFHFDETPKPATCTQSHDYSSVADANGNIYNSQFLIRPSHIGVAFVLTATGSSGSVAQTTFTDANVRVRTNDGTAEITAVLNTNTTCTVDVSSTTTNISAGTNAAQNASVAATSLQSVRLTAPATNSLLQSFVNWTSPNGATFTSINANTICVIGTNSNGALLFQANYAAVQSQTITFSALASKTYGDPSFNLTATASSGLPITYISSNTSVATISGSTVTIVSAGSTIITASQAGDANYNAAASVSQTFTINKRLATWTTDASSKTYGEADPSPLTSGSGNFLAADGVSATYTRVAGETVAGNPYHITATLSATVAGALDNYTITNAGADFTINKRLATWTTDASSKTYGEADPSPLTSGSGDFLAADGVSATYTRAAGETVAGNPYHITASLSASVVGALDNYTITNAGADFTINKRLATWTTDASSKTYGEADPSPLTSGSGNFLAADGVSATYTRAAGETVAGNPYHITALLSATVAGALDNYTITNAGADFTINKRLATWTTDASSKTYGEADPSPLTSGSGNFLAADGVSAIYTRVAGETVAGNPYHITALLSATVAGALDNYTITNAGADFTINKRLATWTTDASSKTYGDADPSPLTSGSGNFLAADGVSATYTRAAGETVAGNPYHITASLSASVAGALDNYTITNAGADFTINKRLATWTTDASSKTYGDADPSPLTSGSGNFLAADGVSATYTRTAGETVASNPYHITATLSASVAGALDNYTITNAGADFTINKRLATWTTDASSKAYGDADPSPLTSGSGDFLAADGVSATYTRAAGETVAGNPYHITASLSASIVGALDNYTITNAGADFTINKRLATWTTIANNKYCGQLDPSPLTTGSGNFLAADGVSATYTRAAGETVAGNPYHITSTLSASVAGALNNYTITNVGADFTINGITSIDASASSMAYPLGTPDTVRATITPNVAGVTVYFHLDNGSGGIYDVSGVTDASGKAQYIWPLGLPVEVYKVTAVAGSGCASTTSAAYLSIYDPNGGFVTGGGWINSPEGAYYANTSLSGRANFGFNSKYKKGSQIPDGNTEFQFQTGNLNFSSISYSSGSLVIAGSQAIYKGVGTINGTTGYSFMVSAIDGQYNGGTGSDKFRIKIWNTSSGAKVYDNMLGVDDNATLDPLTTAIGGGSIVIQNAATKKAAAVRLEPNLITSTDLEVSASPSITSNFFTLTIKSARTEKIAARVFDVNGRTVELLKPVVGERQQFGHSYNGGMYFVEVLQGNQRKMVKLVKQ